jgi:hypothetical protein
MIRSPAHLSAPTDLQWDYAMLHTPVVSRIRNIASVATPFPVFFSALPYLAPLVALRINKRPLLA